MGRPHWSNSGSAPAVLKMSERQENLLSVETEFWALQLFQTGLQRFPACMEGLRFLLLHDHLGQTAQIETCRGTTKHVGCGF